MKQPDVNVGIVHAEKIRFSLNGTFYAKGTENTGSQTAEIKEGSVLWNGNLYKELTFTPHDSDSSFALEEVTIGINFHWERKETQVFSGCLKLIVDEDKLCAINILPVEHYLISVISSEMSANASLEFLKAHAVISRSWLLAQINNRKEVEQKKNLTNDDFFSFKKTDSSLIRWYDREDHTLFDVCADDHCQRYQGITRASRKEVRQAVEATAGEVIMEGDEICDARFSKCCGGISEEYESCWDESHKNYLEAIYDGDDNNILSHTPNLTDEKEAEKWINNSPRAYCNTRDARILSQVLNNYDQETTDFYRWQVIYSQEELCSLISEKTKMNFGKILDIVAEKRGKSGRIIVLKIIGTEKTFSFGKELEIRRILSHSHLFSSAFTVEKVYTDNNPVHSSDDIPDKFVFKGAGWGHGVGLCQIGAAVMGEKGFNYSQILQHYYKNSKLVKVY